MADSKVRGKVVGAENGVSSKKRKRTGPRLATELERHVPNTNSDVDMSSTSSSDISSNDYSEDDEESHDSSEGDSDSTDSDTSDSESEQQETSGDDNLDSKLVAAGESVDESTSRSESDSDSTSDSETDTKEEVDVAKKSKKASLPNQSKKPSKQEQTKSLPPVLEASTDSITATNPTFEELYLKKMTEEYADDIETLRNAPDWNDESLPMLIEFLKQGANHFTEEEKELCMPKPS